MKGFFGDARVMVIGASVFFLIGCLFFTVALTGTNRVEWTGTSIRGTERGGIVYYSYGGQNYSLDVTSRFMSSTVYLDPRHPDSSAMLDNSADRAVDIVTVGAPLALSVVILGVGTFRRFRRHRHERGEPAIDPETTFGRGLDPAIVRRLIEKGRDS